MYKPLTSGIVKSFVYSAAVLLMLFAGQSVTHAASIKQLHIDEVAGQSELVFEGQVISSNAVWNQNRSRIRTNVTFRVDEVLKGIHQADTLTLSFAGGTIGESTLLYQGLIYPKVGEQGIYFVETLGRLLTNPLVGWSQGHFKYEARSGSARMMTAGGKPLMSLEDSAVSKSAPHAHAVELSDGKARGLQLGDHLSEAMTKEDFKRIVKSRLKQASRD